MSRLTPITEAGASAEQGEVWRRITETRGEAVVAEDGGLIGPFNAMVLSPAIGRRFAEMGAAVRGESSLPEGLLELAICTTGAHWRSEFEWWAHRRLAVRAGIPESALDAIAGGETPVFAEPARRAVHAFVVELLTTARVSDSAWTAVRHHLEEHQVVDLVTTTGYYCLISSTLNAFRVPLPDGVTPVWED